MWCYLYDFIYSFLETKFTANLSDLKCKKWLLANIESSIGINI